MHVHPAPVCTTAGYQVCAAAPSTVRALRWCLSSNWGSRKRPGSRTGFTQQLAAQSQAACVVCDALRSGGCVLGTGCCKHALHECMRQRCARGTWHQHSARSAQRSEHRPKGTYTCAALQGFPEQLSEWHVVAQPEALCMRTTPWSTRAPSVWMHAQEHQGASVRARCEERNAVGGYKCAVNGAAHCGLLGCAEAPQRLECCAADGKCLCCAADDC
jgi:hypothetical protein